MSGLSRLVLLPRLPVNMVTIETQKLRLLQAHLVRLRPPQKLTLMPPFTARTIQTQTVMMLTKKKRSSSRVLAAIDGSRGNPKDPHTGQIDHWKAQRVVGWLLVLNLAVVWLVNEFSSEEAKAVYEQRGGVLAGTLFLLGVHMGWWEDDSLSPEEHKLAKEAKLALQEAAKNYKSPLKSEKSEK